MVNASLAVFSGVETAPSVLRQAFGALARTSWHKPGAFNAGKSPRRSKVPTGRLNLGQSQRQRVFGGSIAPSGANNCHGALGLGAKASELLSFMPPACQSSLRYASERLNGCLVRDPISLKTAKNRPADSIGNCRSRLAFQIVPSYCLRGNGPFPSWSPRHRSPRG